MLIVSLSFLYSFSSKRNSNKKVKEIIVEFEKGDNSFLTHSMVDKLLIQNNETVKNQAKSVLDLYGLENKVLRNPYVESVSVFLTIEGMLQSTVKQRTPVARIITKDDSYYVDKQGVKIPLSDNYSARVLLVSGVRNDKNIKEILPLIDVILNDNFLQKEVVGVQKYDNNEFEFSVRSGNYKIDFGELDNIDVKFKKLKAFIIKHLKIKRFRIIKQLQ